MVRVEPVTLAELETEMAAKFPNGHPCGDGPEQYPECAEYHVLKSAIDLVYEARAKRCSHPAGIACDRVPKCHAEPR